MQIFSSFTAAALLSLQAIAAEERKPADRVDVNFRTQVAVCCLLLVKFAQILVCYYFLHRTLYVYFLS